MSENGENEGINSFWSLFTQNMGNFGCFFNVKRKLS